MWQGKAIASQPRMVSIMVKMPPLPMKIGSDYITIGGVKTVVLSKTMDNINGKPALVLVTDKNRLTLMVEDKDILVLQPNDQMTIKFKRI